MQAAKPKRAAAFITKTHEILENPRFAHIICWSADGRMFTILDSQLLTTDLLPRYFKHSKIDSFIRQLNIYGFRKMKKSVALNSFRHPYFVRGDRTNLPKIERRVSSRKTSQRDLSDQQPQRTDEQTSTAQTKQQGSLNSIQAVVVEPEHPEMPFTYYDTAHATLDFGRHDDCEEHQSSRADLEWLYLL